MRAALPATALVAALLAPAAASQITSFSAAPAGPVTATSADSNAVAWADVDGDGDLDLWVANGAGLEFNELYRNEGGGTFVAEAADPLVTVPSAAADGVFADHDGDGDVDLYIASRNGFNNQYFRNQGGAQGGTEGSFVRVLLGPHVSDGKNSRSTVAFDADGDGDVDLFVANTVGQDNDLFVNQGGTQGGAEGTFAALVGVDPVDDGGSSLDAEAGDLDGDGDPDLYVVNGGSENNALYVNQGGDQGGAPGAFAEALASVPAQDGKDGKAAQLADLDGDGDLEVVVANFFQNNAVYRNQGGAQGGIEGLFQQINAGDATSDGAASLGVVAADVDLDGDADLLVTNCCGQDNQLYLNPGDAQFVQVLSGPIVSDGGGSSGGAWADHDQDGDLDLVVANVEVSGVGNNFSYTNASPGTFAKLALGDITTDALRSFDVALGDVDGDGDLDVFVPNKDGDANALFRNDGGLQGGVQGDFERDETSLLAAAGQNSYAAEFGDADGDGDADLALANRYGEDNVLYVNQGGVQGGAEGTFVVDDTSPVSNDGGNSRDICWADVDRDGDLDLFVGNASEEDNRLYINQGGDQGGDQGDFVLSAGVVSNDGGKTFGGEFGDADGDGDLDLFNSCRQGDDNVYYLNQGGDQGGIEGEYVRSFAGPHVNDGGDSYAGTFGDMDLDGDLDLYVSNVGQNFLYRNEGGADGGTEGDFTKLVSGPAVAHDRESRRAEWADLDLDGDLDLFVPNVDGDNTLLRSLGDGRFLDMGSAIAAADGGNSRAVAVGDLDGDDLPDLVVANHDAALTVYRNVSDIGTPLFQSVGPPVEGENGEPGLTGAGTLQGGTPVRFQLVRGASHAVTTIVFGLSALLAPFKGGVLVPTPDVIVVGVGADANGSWSFEAGWPEGIPSASAFYFQVWMPDGLAPFGLSASNGLLATTP